ncbi:AAA family ATPase, partial [Pseudomonas aeruginosa]|nr:AAA family ATPase [Pseudomonas aeruginosa]EKX5071574.1 AAA family ATPase [Pseudomonas aeruginosa]
MHLIKSFTIEKLWGHAPTIHANLDDQFNFIIGRNGTGKTTVINLLAAVLTVDFERLDRIDFEKVTIVFKEPGKRKNPSVEVNKSQKEGLPYCDINYALRESSKDAPIIYDLDALELERYYRGAPSRVMRERIFRERFADIRETLSSLIKVSWLSVHRHSDDGRSPEERKFLPAIDQKLRDLNNSLVRYFSTLSKRYADHTLEFQRKSFLSVLTPERLESLFSFAKKLDLEQEKSTLGEIFQVLGVEPKHYNQKLKVHFEKLTKSLDAARENSQAIAVDDFATLYNAWRAHSLVADYEELQSKKTEIFKPRDSFLEIINGLLEGRKRIALSEKNEITFSTEIKASGKQPKRKDILLEELSSGEKQLLIILGEALLQQSTPSIYIADEPELSLHVLWQEQLTSAISQLNQNSQIIFATHSPDVVGEHDDKII